MMAIRCTSSSRSVTSRRCTLGHTRLLLAFVTLSLLTVCGAVDRECVSYSKPGDVILGGLFPVHYVEGLGKCTERQSRWGTMLSEAMIFAVEWINRRQDILPNVTLGFDIRDDCRSEDVALWHALALVNALNPEESSGLCQPHPSVKVLGIVGTSETPTSIVVTKAAAMYKVPLVSYSASGDELGDSGRFPFFLRTVPQNSLQVQAMIDLLHTFGWVYVSLLHATESDYLHGALRFQEIAPAYGICVAYSAPIRPTAGEWEIDRIVTKLDLYPKVKLVVVIGDKFTGVKVMQAGQRAGMVGRYQWVGGSRWGYLMAEEGLADISDGAIFIRSHNVDVEGFAEFASAKVPQVPSVSPWYKDLAVAWMKAENCTDIRQCPMDTGGSEGPVVDSVLALASALHSLLTEKCGNWSDCHAGDVATEEELRQKLFNVTFISVNGEPIHFDSSGNAGGKFSITNLREGEGEFQVGLWVSSFETVSERLTVDPGLIRFVNKSWDRPRSNCTEDCTVGQIVVPLEEKCCKGCKSCLMHEIVVNGTTCYPCPDKQWPSANRTHCLPIAPSYIGWTEPPVLVILALSGLGLALCGLTVAGLLMYSQHPLIKASSRELSGINVAGLTVIFSTSAVLIAEPTPASCMTVELVLALCMTVIYAPTLLKVNRIFRIFRKARRSTKRPKFISPTHQVAGCLGLIVIQVMLSIFSAVFAPSTPVELVSYTNGPRIELFCSFGPGFIASCVFNLLLILACCLYAFWARKVPSNYNESKFIAISVYSTLVLFLAAVPVYVTATASLQKVATVCIAVILNSYLTLVCLYLPKLYAVRYVQTPENSTTRDWRGSVEQPYNTNQVGPSTSTSTSTT